MLMATTNKKPLFFNGNCKSDRIKKAIKCSHNLVLDVICSRGIYEQDSKNIQRYKKAIKVTDSNKVLVSK